MTAALAKDGNYLPDVRNQYENLPYPARDPQYERTRLAGVIGEMEQYLSHYGYGGKLNTARGFDILVAGGGTGDASIYWAEQLRNTPNTRIVHLDISQASMDIARQRAAIRKLENITFVHGSLLDAATLGLGTFDHINCCGVLHHLADPVAGLNALKSVLKPEGIINIMVYGQYGRTQLYHMQEIMRRINKGVENIDQQVKHAHAALDVVRERPWGKLLNALYGYEIERNGDIGLYDMYLHSQDRAYTVHQLYDYVESCGLVLSHWVHSDMPYNAIFSTKWIADPALRDMIDAKPQREREAILEMMHGTIRKHQCYVSFGQREVASADDESMIPDYSFFFPQEKMASTLAQLGPHCDGQTLDFKTAIETKQMSCNPLLRHLLAAIDGQRSMTQIVDAVASGLADEGRSDTSREQIKTVFMNFYREMNNSNWLLLRHPSVPRYPTHLQVQQRGAEAAGF